MEYTCDKIPKARNPKKTKFNPNSDFIKNAVKEFKKRGGKIKKHKIETRFYEEMSPYSSNARMV